MITQDLIQEFRERANRNRYVSNKYQNYEGKNLWSCICSSMDWITVATSYLAEHSFPERIGNDDISSVNVYTFISCVDMVFEAVKQLHRVFVAKNSIPFEGEKCIFRDNDFCRDDNHYFKMIRACFGAHSVNLNDYFTSPQKKEKRFASWSGGFFSNRDYAVLLHSDSPGEESILLEISFAEIENFLERTYGYLKVIIALIDEDEGKFREELRQKRITNSIDPVEQLQILRNENKKRYKVEYYANIIEELEIIFGTHITDAENFKKVKEYRLAMMPTVEELHVAIQEMNLGEIDSYEEINDTPFDFPHFAEKGFDELTSLVFKGLDTALTFLQSLIQYISKTVKVSGRETFEELYVLTKTAMYISIRDGTK